MSTTGGGAVTAPTGEVASTNDDEQLSARVRFFRHPGTAVVTTAASMFAMLILGGLLSALMYMAFARITGHTAEGTWRTIIMVASYGCIAGFAVLLILLWRKLARVPLRGLGLAASRRLWLLIPGFALAIGVNYAVAGIAVTAGAAEWSSEQPVLLAYPTLLSIVVIFFGQAFPEELLWRGHLAGLLRLRMGTRGIIITTSLGFGVLHILSGNNAQNFGDQLIYVVQAIALGCLLIAMRLGASSLWLAVGFHTGYNVFLDVVAPMPGSYWVEILTRVIVLAILATIALLAWLKLRQRPSAFAR